MSKLNLTSRKRVVAILVCTILASTLVAFYQMNQSAQAAVLNPHPGLVGWWRFDESSGSLAADSSGNNNDGTSYGTTVVGGKFGNALQFSGTFSYVRIPDATSLSPTKEVTVEAWVYPTSNSGQDYKRIVCKSAGGDTGEYTLWLYNSGRVIWYVNDWAHGYVVSSTIPLNQWTHIVGTFNGTLTSNRLKIYINGVLNTQGATTDSVITRTTTNLFVGDRGNEDRGFAGLIDEVQVYNRALSSTEIQAASQNDPDFSSTILAEIPKGTTQIIATLSWQGTGDIGVTIVSPSQSYAEATLPVYQKTSYSTTDGVTSMLNIKRLSVTVSALPADQNWDIELTLDAVDEYQISIETQR